jgi:hypothetical protein
MPAPTLHLRLSVHHRQLLLTYTMPFEAVEAQLQALASQPDTAHITLEPFDLEHLLADLVYSAKRLRRTALLEQLDELYTELELQARHQGVRV